MIKCKNFNLKKPCANCPFRKAGAIELAPGRVESILQDLKRHDNKIFVCHKTLDSKEISACMGALAYQWRDGRIPILARLALMSEKITPAELDAVAPELIDPITD